MMVKVEGYSGGVGTDGDFKGGRRGGGPGGPDPPPSPLEPVYEYN